MLVRLIGEDVDSPPPSTRTLEPVLADPGQLEQMLDQPGRERARRDAQGGRLTIETANVELDDAYAARARRRRSAGPYVDARGQRHRRRAWTPRRSARIFEPFFTTKAGRQGHRLGLATVYGIVQAERRQHLGLQRARARHDVQGLPAALRGVPLATNDRVRDTLRSAPRRSSSPRTRRFCATWPRSCSRSAATRSSPETPQQALDRRRAEAEHIDLLLTDLVMPHMGGLELATRLRAGNPDLRVLFMSGYAGEALTQNGGLDLGSGFIEKPFSSSELAQQVRAILDGRDLVDPLLRCVSRAATGARRGPLNPPG